MVKVYIVIEIGAEQPRIVGVYRNRKSAEAAAYADPGVWCNIIEKKLEG